MSIHAEILEWSKDRPGWQRDALRRLFTAGHLTPDDLEDVTTICKSQHGLSPAQPIQYLDTAHVPAGPSSASSAVSLASLTHHMGVNALAPEQTISFGANLTVVYGENAAGKSGYTRILKRACRSRFVEDILGDVLAGSVPLKAKATIRYRQDDAEVPVSWTPDGAPSSSLSQICVFDSHCVPVYLKDKNDVAFRPFGLDTFDKLATACAEVKKRLDLESQRIAQPFVPPRGLAEGTQAKRLVDTITSLTSKTSVQALATLTTIEAQRLNELATLRRDLQSADPKARARELLAKATRFETLSTHLKSLDAALGLAAISRLDSSRKKLATAREHLSKIRDAALAVGVLPGTGDRVWRSMWEATEAFAKVAYPGVPFPPSESDALCPFCQQQILPDTASRLKHFAEYVGSAAQADVRLAEQEYSTLWQVAAKAQVARQDIDQTIDEIASDDAALGDATRAYLAGAQEVRDALVAQTEATTAPFWARTFDPDVVPRIMKASLALREHAQQLSSSQTALSVVQQKELTELESRVVLKDNLQLVMDEIERKKRLAAYGLCVEETNTLAITKKSTELTKRLVSDQLRDTFQEELRRLEFTHVAVAIQPAGGSRGALFHKLVFSNAPGVTVTDIVSEGESRTLSLAAFLTELSTAPTVSGIIFDDPVSSLDHVWRGRIAQRLVLESKHRQVIVFTHDLWFMRALMSGCEKAGIPCAHQYVRRDGQAGLSSPDLPWVAMTVKERIGVLRARWQDADAIRRKNGMQDYKPKAQEIYSLLRETWERGITEILLNDVVDRYRPSIETKRAALLFDITEDDCKAVDAGMTECSRWMLGHDESIADGSPFPEPTTVKARIDELEAWTKTIKKRRRQ